MKGEPVNRTPMTRAAIGLGAALLLAVALLSFASAQNRITRGNDVDVNLVLAIDASGSVEDDRFELQKRGFAAAFRDPKVLQAIRAGSNQSIGVFMLQWTGPTD